VDQGEDRITSISIERFDKGWYGDIVGLLELQHSTVDSFMLEAPMGIVLKEEQEINPERDNKKKDLLPKRG
jgi:hypothetical protein